jgi:hypothetical protein
MCAFWRVLAGSIMIKIVASLLHDDRSSSEISGSEILATLIILLKINVKHAESLNLLAFSFLRISATLSSQEESRACKSGIPSQQKRGRGKKFFCHSEIRRKTFTISFLKMWESME